MDQSTPSDAALSDATSTTSDTTHTTSIRTALLTLAGSTAIALLLGAQGIVHAAHGMPYGTERTVMLAAGNDLLHISRNAHLTGAWDTAQTALGRPQDTAQPPLLAASGGTTAPVLLRTSQPAGSHPSRP